MCTTLDPCALETATPDRRSDCHPSSMAAGLLVGTTTFLPVPPPHASARLAAASAARSPLCRRQAARMLADDEFDYVIVGGGTAGCVLANRLSADERTRVLLLEPGPSVRGALKVAVPVALVKLFNSEWDWSFKAHPRAESNLRANIHLARGRALGGSSATNALLYHRGTAEDFDAWACDGWGSAEMLRAFRRVEGQRRRTLRSSPFHSTAGPVSVEDARYTNSLSMTLTPTLTSTVRYTSCLRLPVRSPLLLIPGTPTA